ncbi:PAS domain S-box-containing protein [Streptomyces sp. KhCrAH-43]|uniref:PAS domain-containing protein n=1 Tax=unclassified Streptomyces TaxID=2593676 RepID=UPI000372E462|nr:PAS domain-containing protein [Streptomyces sp. KhCrAH-43]MYS33872.1 PAS domain-containing protein [Streptomyces sp. SID4920]MYX70349.1 PAS domain-containing protein [Streptomyces sp. SID8373]RAJ60842.1 PAS domain S-box-containing protein [Streptomyces sp. KhCrAH-43]
MSSRPSRGAARLAAILDALPDGLLLVNCNGTVVNANTIALEMFETPGTALVGRGLLDLLPEFDSKLIPGSMRRPEAADERGRTKPTRMIARRTDGNEYPVEVTSASLEDGQAAYKDVQGSYGGSYTGDELLMLVVRDLSGTVDTEAELARSQRQTEMILRAAAEGVVGTDTDGRVVLVNPAAAQILGFRASDLGGQELHPLILHSRAEGEPFPYEESPLADTLKSGRKHRVRGQVLWSKSGEQVPVDLTTAPVRDGDQLVGAVMTFTDRRPYEELEKQRRDEAAELAASHTAEVTELTERHAAELAALKEAHAAELADRTERYASELEEQTERLTDLTARHTQLTAVLGESLRGPLEELRGELSALAADPAGQLWPEANQILHHLAAGYARMTTLIDNVLSYQRLDDGAEALVKTRVLLDGVVTAGIDASVELIGPGRAQFAVHAPPIEAEVDAGRLVTALAHLVADVAGVDSTGKARVVPGGGYVDSTVVVAAAQRGDVVRIEVRGPFAGGDPVHVPIVSGIVRAHGGVLQTHEMPGMSGSAYVLEVPIGAGAGTVAPPEPAAVPQVEAAPPMAPESVPVGEPDHAGPAPADDPEAGRGRRRARRSSTDAFLESPVGGSDGTGELEAAGDTGAAAPTGRRRARRAAPAPAAAPNELIPAQQAAEGSGRRRGRPSPAETGAPGQALALPSAAPSEGSVVTAAEGAQGAGARPQRGQTVPPQGVPAEAQVPVAAGGHRGNQGAEGRLALPPVVNAIESAAPAAFSNLDQAARPAPGAVAPPPDPPAPAPQPSGRRARRALAAAQDRAAADAGPRVPFALPPADADRAPTEGVEPEGSGLAADTRGIPGGSYEVGVGTREASGGTYEPGVGAPRTPGTAAPDALAGAPEHAPVPPQAQPAPTGRRRARHGDTGAQEMQPAPFALPGQMAGAPAAPGAQGDGPASFTPTAQGDGPAPFPQPAQNTPPAGTPIAPPAPNTPGDQASPFPQAAQSTPPAGTPVAPDAPGDPNPGAPDAPAAPPAHPGAWGDDDASGQGPAVPETQSTGATAHTTGAAAPTAGAPAAPPVRPRTPAPAPDARRQPLPAEAPMPGSPDSTQGRAFSVRTLGQGVPFAQHIAHQQNQTLGGGSSVGRRRKLAAPPEPDAGQEERPAIAAASPAAPAPAAPQPAPPAPATGGTVHGQGSGQLLSAPAAEGRAYAIGAPDEGAAEGPEPLDGPGGAVEVANRPSPQPVDDELPPEPLDNPRRLLVWPAPDVSTQQALSDRGYRPVIVHSREEVDAQIAAFPAALFVDPLTGPITRKALQSLRQAAVAAEVPVLVTAGLGQASREAAYGADPAVLLKALAPRDSEQHPPRVLLIEEHEDIAVALTETLERRGMQVACAATDSEAVSLATRMRPNLVVMDLMQVRRRRAGIVDWLRANGQLNRTPLVVYTSADIDRSELPRLGSGETVLFLAERSTSDEVQSRIVDLLAKIGTN